jgi:hypothetical protein
MSDNLVTNVSVGTPKVKGSVFRAPYGTALPTTANADLDKAFENMGYISDAGVVNSNSVSTSTVKAWGKDTVLITEDEKTDTFQMTFLEALNANVLKLVYGEDNVEGDIKSGLTIKANSTEQEDFCYVIDMVLRGNTLKRITIPCARLTELGDVSYTDGDAIGYEVTLTCQPDTEGNTHYEYLLASDATATQAETTTTKSTK